MLTSYCCFLRFTRILLEEYGSHLARLATAIFGAMAENLHLDPELSKTYISESTGFVRVYRYPQCSMENEAWGINVHTDSSVLSVLNQDQVAGLQVLKDDNWLQVKPIPDTLIFNLGDMMQAISDDKYKSVKHRVKLNKEKDRFSICYFVFPAEGSVIHSSKYRPFTYSDFQAQVQQDVKTLGFKVGLERFRAAERELDFNGDGACTNGVGDHELIYSLFRLFLPSEMANGGGVIFHEPWQSYHAVL
ncbi:GIBBERELLIN 2-BETA-DIOXYGENASE 3-LIKE ISOFORM X1 [Salix purpurea]|uniref:GIBBERELLIN 2-BETA-DIOXYGENASE 3-LIKE ISOFORM X1 n=1 Tax=Salix purpurea TaxID=77065 RepID=A0A9Q0VV87_SALPP|nr:GIBBERELLIN 2-BETA-DIOXYGENASE 3-LIKE ISOFORM X1 [Salix purpurea]